MQTTRLFTLLTLIVSVLSFSNLSAQATTTELSGQAMEHDPGNSKGPFHLSKSQLLQLGYRMWYSYAGGTVDGLTKWDGSDADHQCMYLGIAQSIWLPEGANSRYQEDWPTMAQYLQDHGCKIKKWMLQDCPWSSEEEFDAQFKGHKMTWLRKHLARDKFICAQAFCVAERLKKSMDRSSTDSLLTGLTDAQSVRVEKNYHLVMNSQNPSGVYALIDYVNFKGDGRLGGTEEFNGQGWGLLQVLLNMETPEEGACDVNVIKAFVESATSILRQRIHNHEIQDPESNDGQYLDEWVAHLNDYLLTTAEVQERGWDQAPAAPVADDSKH